MTANTYWAELLGRSRGDGGTARAEEKYCPQRGCWETAPIHLLGPLLLAALAVSGM